MKKIFPKNCVSGLSRGFTLVELMMVIAIIGLIAAVALAALTDARDRGRDTAVKTNLAVVRTQAELFFVNNGNSYLPAGGSTFAIATCPTYSASGTNFLSKDKNTADAIAEAVKRGSGASSCYTSSVAWAVAVGLKAASTSSWCVDSAGVAKIVASAPASAINSSTFVCN